jgi:hypothetical protein
MDFGAPLKDDRIVGITAVTTRRNHRQRGGANEQGRKEPIQKACLSFGMLMETNPVYTYTVHLLLAKRDLAFLRAGIRIIHVRTAFYDQIPAGRA